MLLSTAYLPNIQYISKFQIGEPVIEAYENFQKQSFRNRTRVMTADGVRSLIVPVARPSGERMRIQEVRVDQSEPWQRSHWRTLTAAYAQSPYFEHYSERFLPYYQKSYDFLWDLNCDLLKVILEIFGIEGELNFSTEFEVEAENDFRNTISPKPQLEQRDSDFIPPIYYQVFGDRQPFAPNLSILDYLFCEGAKLRL